MKSNGPAICVLPNVTAVCHANNADARSVTSERGTCRVCMSNADTTNNIPITAPARAPYTAHITMGVSDSSTRRDNNWFAVPPASAPANANVRMRCTAG